MVCWLLASLPSLLDRQRCRAIGLRASATIGPPMTFGYIPALDVAETCR